MARYFFHVHHDQHLTEDSDGVEMSWQQVRASAMEALCEMACEAMPKGGDRQTMRLVVTNEAGVEVYTAKLTFEAEPYL
jgi:hypothetical protein